MGPLFTRLLLATEHTEFDTGAEAVALVLAQRCELPLATVLPLVSNPEYEALAPHVAARDEQAAAAKIADLRAQAQAAQVTIDLRLRRGEEPYREIVDEAAAQGTELIIIRRRGKRSFLANLLVGEMVSKVVAHAPCHVLIVPRQARMWGRRLLAAAEPTPQGRQIVAIAMAVAAESHLPLHLVSVVGGDSLRAPAEAFVAEMARQAQHAGVATQAEVRCGKAFTEILAAQSACQADLLVMGSRSDHRIGRDLFGGVAQKVLGLSDHPVLVLRSS
jgi:nucleotide-binding universal stress UspA family protein